MSRLLPCAGTVGAQDRDKPSGYRRHDIGGDQQTMQENFPDKPGVIALPPVILGGAVALGLILNFIWPANFLSRELAIPLGILIALGAVGLAFLAVREMHAANTPLDVRKASKDIVSSGVFRFTRNPIYLGMVLLCVGIAFLVNSLWILCLAVPLAFILQKGVIEREEAYLERKFGEKYLRYKASVRRWL